MLFTQLNNPQCNIVFCKQVIYTSPLILDVFILSRYQRFD
nr:MAG TPA: hypothetical protein [Caudoviricetes sp.]DAH61175.1 MAG TPA: hypothetical protein [Caudoviricetes sp.]